MHKCACKVSFVLWFIPSSKSGNDLSQLQALLREWVTADSTALPLARGFEPWAGKTEKNQRITTTGSHLLPFPEKIARVSKPSSPLHLRAAAVCTGLGSHQPGAREYGISMGQGSQIDDFNPLPTRAKADVHRSRETRAQRRRAPQGRRRLREATATISRLRPRTLRMSRLQ